MASEVQWSRLLEMLETLPYGVRMELAEAGWMPQGLYRSSNENDTGYEVV